MWKDVEKSVENVQNLRRYGLEECNYFVTKYKFYENVP